MTTPETRPVRVLIVEDHPLMARGLSALLEDEVDIEVAGLAGSVQEACSAVVASPLPDVVVMDFRLPDGTGAEAALAIRSIRRVPILFLSADATVDALVAAVEAGGVGYLLKSDPPEHLLDALRRAARGEIVIPPEQMHRLMGVRRELAEERKARARVADSLTARERDTLRLIAEGADNRAIAGALGVGVTTARTHVRNILTKLDAHSKLEALAIAHELRLLDLVPKDED